MASLTEIIQPIEGLAGSLVRSLFCGLLNQDKRVAVFTAFSDESGTGDNQGPYLVGGYVAVESLWGDYAQLWQDQVLDAPPPIKHLHMREIRRQEFQKENKLTPDDAEAKVDAATRLLSEIASRSHPWAPKMHAVLSVIERTDLYDMVALVESAGHRVARGTLDLPDYLCFLGYAQTVLAYTLKMFPDLDKVDFVASRNGKVTEHYKTYLAGIKKRYQNPDIVGELVPADPVTRNPLQMADVLCWHTRLYYDKSVADINMTRLMQTSRFTHVWKRGELEDFTQSVIDRLDEQP